MAEPIEESISFGARRDPDGAAPWRPLRCRRAAGGAGRRRVGRAARRDLPPSIARRAGSDDGATSTTGVGGRDAPGLLRHRQGVGTRRPRARSAAPPPRGVLRGDALVGPGPPRHRVRHPRRRRGRRARPARVSPPRRSSRWPSSHRVRTTRDAERRQARPDVHLAQGPRHRRLPYRGFLTAEEGAHPQRRPRAAGRADRQGPRHRRVGLRAARWPTPSSTSARSDVLDNPGPDPTVVVVHVDADVVDGTAEGNGSIDGIPIPVDSVRRLLCDCEIEYSVDGPDGTCIGIGRAGRTPPRGCADGSTTATATCRFPGCGGGSATSTTSSTGPMTVPPTPTTSSASAGTTTTSSTKAAGPSRATPTTSSPSPARSAASSARDRDPSTPTSAAAPKTPPAPTSAPTATTSHPPAPTHPDDPAPRQPARPHRAADWRVPPPQIRPSVRACRCSSGS